jgi:hypothetical protein
MKKTMISLCLLLGINTCLISQRGTPVSELFLQGKWRASCPLEVMDKATIKMCELCSFETNPTKPSQGKTKDFEMDFQADKIALRYGEETSTVSYSRDKNTHSISFNYKGRRYHFRVFFHNNERILVNKDRTLLVLKQAE